MEYRIKPIKDKASYDNAINMVTKLIAVDPLPGTEDGDKLEVLSALIKQYEDKYFSIEMPNAIEAIKFRMDQMDLRPSDLAPYLGGASRVSEILSGKRKLTINMIKMLSDNLGIPEKALIRQELNENEYSRHISNTVFNAMKMRNYFGKIEKKSDKAEILKLFFERHPKQVRALYRKSSFRMDNKANYYATVAWANRVLDIAKDCDDGNKYTKDTVTLDYMREIVHFSIDENNGARKAIEKLARDGITVVVEPPLDGTKIDGVCIFEEKEHPVIGMTLRYDRLDNFWFTLMHELAHVSKHLHTGRSFIYDDLEMDNKTDALEKEADILASEALVDTATWLHSPAKINPLPITIEALAKEIGVHPAIIAGKARYETGRWNYLSGMVKKSKIRDQFKEKTW